MTMSNPILKELHDIRAQILAEHGDDLGAYLHSEFQRAKASGHPVAKIKQRTIRSLYACAFTRMETRLSVLGDGYR